jgi:hypothetical protein
VQSEEMQAGPVPSEPVNPPDRPPPRRWFRRRWVLALASGLVVLVALGVVADLVLTRYVKDGVVQALRCATGNDKVTPTVSLGGAPVLVGLATRKLDQVTISGLSPAAMDQASSSSAAASSGSSGPALKDGKLTITLHGLGLGDPPSLKSAEAAVWLPWAGLSDTLTATPSPSSSPSPSPSPSSDSDSDSDDLAGATLGAQDGLLAVTLPQEVAGKPLKVLVSLEPDGGSMTVTPESIVVGGRKIGVGLISLLAGDLLKDKNGESRLKPRTVDLDLPGGTTVHSLKVETGGLAMDLDIDPALVRENGGAGADCLG